MEPLNRAPEPLWFHASMGAAALDRRRSACLEKGAIDPVFHYGSWEQGRLWSEVAAAHSPAGAETILAAYDKSAEAASEALRGQALHLVALGPGGGQKEARLGSQLRAAGIGVQGVTAVDANADLVIGARRRLVADVAFESGSLEGRALVADLCGFEALGDWLGENEVGSREAGPAEVRCITAFGVSPNLEPKPFFTLLAALLRPGSSDLALVSANLARVREGAGPSMEEVVPEYDNRETRRWLGQLLKDWGLAGDGEVPMVYEIGELDRVPAVVARCRVEGEKEMRLFFSLRYSPEGFEAQAAESGLKARSRHVSACGREGIWLLQRG